MKCDVSMWLVSDSVPDDVAYVEGEGEWVDKNRTKAKINMAYEISNWL